MFTPKDMARGIRSAREREANRGVPTVSVLAYTSQTPIVAPKPTALDRNAVKSLRPGDRIALHPAEDLWMRGIRYGTVTLLGTKWVHFNDDNGHKRKVLYPGVHSVVSQA